MFSDVMNTIATPVAIIAAILALVSVIQSSNQFKRNLQVQERAINLGLLDDRVEILEDIKKGLFSFNRQRVRFLFEGEILELFERYDECAQALHDYATIRTTFINHLNETIWHDDFEKDEAEDFKNAYWDYYDKNQSNAYSQNELAQIRSCLNKFRLTFAVDELGISPQSYSIIEIEDKIAEYNRELNRIEMELPPKMESYIKESITDKAGR